MRKQKFQFPGQRKNEQIRFVLRKNWVIHFFALARTLFFAVLPVAFLISVLNLFAENFPQSSLHFLLSISIFIFVFILQFLLTTWMNDELDLLVVTDKRVIDITEIDFLHRNISEAPLSQVQDVKGEIHGFWGTIFRFGKVKIFTANHTAIFEIDRISRPLLRSRKILDFVQNDHDDDEIEAEAAEKASQIKQAFLSSFNKLFGR